MRPHTAQSPARMLLLPHACPTSSLRRCSPLPNERIALLPFPCVHRTRRRRQLKHGCVLAFAHPGEQHDLLVGELQRIVMHARLAHVDLPELCHFLPELPELQARQKSKKSVRTLLPFRTRSPCPAKGTLPRSALQLQRTPASGSPGTSLLPACRRPSRVGMRRGPDCNHTLRHCFRPTLVGARTRDARRGPGQRVGWSTERFGMASRSV